MKFKNPMLVVTDMERSVAFYKKVFGLHVIMDFGANKTLTGGLALQTMETYQEFIGTSAISFGGNNFEIYFEADDFDQFAARLKACDVEYVHPIKEHAWGQRHDAGGDCSAYGCTDQICKCLYEMNRTPQGDSDGI